MTMKKPYKVMACFDTETTNDNEQYKAFSICYQFSELKSKLISANHITNENVHKYIDITIDRHFTEVCSRFDKLKQYGLAESIVPVIMVHNLAFEMWILSSYLNKHEVNVCAKSSVKPLTLTIFDNGEPTLVFWDTLSFWGKSLEKLGDECGYHKLSGCWDYEKYRTPETPLNDKELGYAMEDVTVPWCYLGYYMRLNREIDEEELAHKILTKTSAVRYKSMKRCGNFRINNKTTAYMWRKQNKSQLPKTDDELELLHAGNRGGLTYCASNHAGKVFKSDGKHRILKYDANSMHICQALSHKVPVDYRWKTPDFIIKCFECISNMTVNDILDDYSNPFPGMCFIAVMRFTNVRLKRGSVYERDGISSFAWSRFVRIKDESSLMEDNEGGMMFNDAIFAKGVHDYASEDATHYFGKYYGSRECTIVLNELSSWEFAQQFEYDTVEVLGDGLWTGRTTYATDKSILSFNNFFRAKSVVKKLKNAYEQKNTVETVDYIPEYLMTGMKNHDDTIANDVENYYLSVKGDLNSLYGIEATNEAKNKIEITKDGLICGEYKGCENLPKNPKAWFQYGSHIVGFSRIHQIIFIELLKDKVDAFICGDTDSHKIYTCLCESDIDLLLKPLHDACDKAQFECTERARKIADWFPMVGLGYYECEGIADEFMAAWNKAYIQLSHDVIDITLAGVPCNAKFHNSDGSVTDRSYNRLANTLYESGMPFHKIAEVLLGYNVTISYEVTGLNQRDFPEWGKIDECGEPRAIRLYRMDKKIGDTNKQDNYLNMLKAESNNSLINTRDIYITWNGDTPVLEIVP